MSILGGKSSDSSGAIRDVENGAQLASSLCSGDLIGRDTPKVVAVVGGMSALDLVDRAESEGADILEIRCDLFENNHDVRGIKNTVRAVAGQTTLPLLITTRRLEEGGLYYSFDGSEKRRYEIFNSAMEYVDLVDIELTAEIRDKVISKAREFDVIPIVSHHNFYSTPRLDELREKAKEAYDTDADIVKIATMADHKKDVITLLKLLLEFNDKYKNKSIAAISMSDIGRVSRLVFPIFGSCLTYAYVSDDGPNAPGQLSVSKVREFIDEHKTEIRKVNGDLPIIRKAIEKNISPFSTEKLEAMLKV